MRKPVVVIVGGGPAGAATAFMLARRGLTPVVLEAERGPTPKIGECLPPNANPLLELLGIKEKLCDGHVPAYGTRAVWGSPVPFERDFLFSPHGSGWHLDRLKFEEALACAAQRAGADWRYGWRLIACEGNGRGWSLKVRNSSGEAGLEADFIVDATGRSHRLARQLGVRHIRYDRLVGAAVLLQPQDEAAARKDSFALVEAVASGWWYSALLPGGSLMVVYLTDSDLVEHAVLQRKESWLGLLSEAEVTWRRVGEGGYTAATGPQIYPAGSVRLEQITGERWAAVGDSAAAYDPLSSYGISAALGAGCHAASAIADFLLGESEALRAYGQVMDRAYARYLMMNYSYYGLERRWPGEPFWRRRHRAGV